MINAKAQVDPKIKGYWTAEWKGKVKSTKEKK